MSPSSLARLERIGVALLLAAFALPLLLGLCLLPSRAKVPATLWLRNRSLFGAALPWDHTAPTRANLLTAKFQSAVATNYNLRFTGRELMIRCFNELSLRLLHASSDGIVVGPHLSLVQPNYLEDYCFLRGPSDSLRPLVDDLRRMQDFCDARGMGFALVITPSKAAVCPEQSPRAWTRLRRPGLRYYDEFVPLLRARGVRYVDGHRIAARLKRTAPAPVFPLGGIHWGDPAALATSNALLATLARAGVPVQPIAGYTTTLSRDPYDQDSDMADLANTVFPWHYPVATVHVRPQPPPPAAYRPNAVFVGGSFTWKLLDLLDASQQFSELDFLYYYQHSKNCHAYGENHEVAKPAPPVDFATDVFAADALVLEVNEETLHVPAWHLTAFLHDALAALPDPHALRAPFHYESRLRYHWGDAVSFAATSHPTNMSPTTGLSTPTSEGSYTIGSLATIRLVTEPPPQDMALEVVAKPFLVDQRLTSQRVGVSVNGHTLGDWRWDKRWPSRREWIVPKEFLTGGEVRVEFHVADPRSPAEFGINRDPLKYGLIISRVRLYPAR